MIKYEIGSQPPDGYVEWHTWADVQTKSGLRQKKCPNCGLWRFPQETDEKGVCLKQCGEDE